MLTRLTVENYALIERLELVLDPHLNIITGETGAGKSILLGALGLLLGAKNDGATIKDNERNCVIEGTFDITGLGLETLFEEMDIDYDNETVIRRIITPAGKSRSYVNDLPVQLSQLKELGTHLIDIHSQHQNLILASEAFRTQALDTIAANGTVMNSYREEYTRFKSLERRLAELKTAAAEAGKEEEWIRFQAGELTSANLREGEVEELEAEQAELENADTTSETLAQITASFDGDEEGVLVSLKNAENGLRHISSSYKPAGELADRIHSTILELRDINATVAADAERIESDPERLEKVNDRLATLYTLCQKHRVQNVDELIVLRDKFRKQLEAITSGDEEIAALEAETAAARTRASALADKLHDGRAKAAPAFGSEMAGRLTRLGMPDARFTAEVTEGAELTPAGRDTVTFLFSANKSMTPQPAERIASGGEMSRMMLSLKSLLASRMKLPTIIFDEIDTGVSGRIADAMGEIISELSQSMQVVNITHLPQVASKGEAHFVVYKENSRSDIKRLTADERIVEIAKMLSGSEISDAALTQARILLSRE